jgi:hypothetical protein
MTAAVRPRRSTALLAALLAALLPAAAAHAFTVTINAGTRTIYLQVGAGTMTGGTFSGGGTPQDNGTINRVSVTVPAASLGGGTVDMTSNSTVSASPYDGFAFCTTPAQVYVGGFHRRPFLSNGTATLTVTTPATLGNGSGQTIPFTEISWVSGGANDATPTIPSGTFNGGTQTLLSVPRNTWFESCLTFRYANSQRVAAGTFTGRAVYTLTAP